MEKKHVHLIAKTVLTFAAVVVIALAGKLPAEAATAPSKAPTGLKETAADNKAFAMEWNKVSGADYYTIYAANSKKGNYSYLGFTDSNKVTISSKVLSGIKAGSSYWVKVAAAVVDETGKSLIEGAYSAPVEMVTAPNDVKNLKHVSSTTNSIKISWSASTGATTYGVYYAKPTDAKWKGPKTTTGKSYTLTKLSKNQEYDVKVRAGRKSSAGFTAWSAKGTEKDDVPVKPSKVKGVKVWYPYTSPTYNRISKVRIQCTPIVSADGYKFEVQGADKKKIKTVTTNSKYDYQKDISASKIKSNKFIRVRVRAYCKNSKGEKKYGDWSDWTYTCQQPKIKKVERAASGFKITWDKVEGASRYAVYVSTKPDKGYKKVATPSSSKRSATITKDGNKKKIQSGKTYYYYVVAEKKVNGKYVQGAWGYYWRVNYY